MNEYALDQYGGWVAAEAPASARVAFIRRTYVHVALAIVAFVGIEAALLSIPGIGDVIQRFFGMGRFAPLILIGGFMLTSWVAESWARSNHSRGLQYVGLGLYVVLEALIFLPLLWMATTFEQFAGVLPQAAIVTLAIAAGLTLAVLITRQDFSFLGPILSICFMAAFAVILAGLLFGFNLGLFFSFVMVALASAAILYQTSNILHHYRTDQHVAAALALFAAIALLFWWILRIFMSRRD